MNTRAGGGGRKIRGVIIGIVTNIKDPEEIGRVKVRFPWMDGVDDPIESHWARLCGWYAGNSRGTLYVPEIGDEVLVAFEGGDPNHPYILGAVFNGEHDVPGPGNPDGKNDHKWFRSRAGHDFEFLDTDGAEKIRLVDSSQNNSVVYDTAADTWTTEAKTGTINISAPKGYIHIDCVDFTQTTTKSRKLEVGEKHTVTVGNARTLNVDDANWVVMAGTSMTITTPQFESTTKTDVGVQAGMMVNNQGMYSTEVGKWTELQQGPVVRTAGTQTIATSAYTTVNTQGDSPAVFTLLAGALTVSSKGGVFFNGGPTTMMGGLINSKSSGAVMAKDMNGGKAALSTWLGGLLLLNPNTLTFPATKLLDPIVGMDMHGPTLPAPIPPPAGPLPPLPMVPMPFAGPILIDFKATVLINFMPAAGAGATAISFHMPPLPWPWVPMSYRPILTAAIMALATAPFNAMLEMAKGKMAAMAAGSSSPTLKRGFIADFIGSSHVESNAGKVKSAGKTYSVNKGDQGQFSFTRIFPMFSSGQAFLGFLAGLLPLPVATATVNMSSPTTSVCDAPLGMMMPMGSNSCSDVPPIIPNAMPVGFSNVLTGMSIGDFLGQLAWGMVQGAATRRFQGGLRRGGNALARRIGNSNSPRLQNAAQRVNDFLGGDNCIARGHPVDVVSGTLFTQAIDFALFGAQSLVFRRFYNTKAEDMRGDASAFGPGWRHCFDQVLIADETKDGVRTLALRDDENKIIGFDLPLVDGESDFHPYLRLTLTRVDGRTYRVRARDGVERVFRFSGGTDGQATPPTYQPGVGKIARLVQLIEPGGGAGVRLTWRRTRLAQITDPSGRVVEVKSTASGQIAELRLKESGGQACDVFLARYRYDGDGRLIAHEDRNHNLRWYRYDRRARLVRETDRNGYSWHFHYDEEDRCTHTYGDDNAYYCAFEYIPSCTVVGDALGGVTRYKYDDQSRVTEIHDAEGGITVKTYTAAGQIETLADPRGGVMEWVYDDEGRVIEAIDPLGNSTTHHHDATGLIEVVDPLGNRWRTTRRADGMVTETRTPSGRTRSFERDAQGRITALVEADGSRLTRTWGADGLVKRDRRADGMRADYRYDLLGRLTAIEQTGLDGERWTVELTLDGEGRVTGLDDSRGRRERYTFDPEGRRLIQEIGGRRSSRRYTGWGRLAEHVDQTGRVTRLEYDGNERLSAVHLPGGRAWRYRCDKMGRVAWSRSPDGVVRTFARDPLGQAVEERRADRVIRRQFDPIGNVTKVEWGQGGETRLKYDVLGRLIEAKAAGDRPIKRAYSRDGHLVTEVQGDAAVRWQYDALGRISRRVTDWGGDLRYSWSSKGLTGLRDSVGGEHWFEHDARGRRVAWHQPGGAALRTEWDPLGRLTATRLQSADGAPTLQRQLRWSANDTLESVDERRAERRYRHGFGYDDADRLTLWQRNDQGERGFVWDDADNLVADPGGAERAFEGDRLVANGDGDRFRYDQTGRWIATDGSRARRLWYDDRDRLTCVHTADDRIVHLRYDALGRCVEALTEADSTGYRRERFYWEGPTLARRVIEGADGEATEDEEYCFDPQYGFRPLLRIRGAEDARQAEYYVTDQRGAALMLSDAIGEPIWAAQYDPFGRCLTGDDATAQPLRMAGQVHCDLAGLSLHRYRAYDPQHGRFTVPDPLGLRGGDNQYAWPSDPLAWADPLGLNAWNDFQRDNAGNGLNRTQTAERYRVPDSALHHADTGDFNTNGRMTGGGHGQSNMDHLNANGIPYNVENTYGNGVRTGNVPATGSSLGHKSKNKRTGDGQSWFPSTWDADQIRTAGADVHRNHARPGDVGPHFGEVDGVRVGIFTDPDTGKVSTIFPDAGNQPC